MKILFFASYPNLTIGYSRVANILSNFLAEQCHEIFYLGISNFPSSSKIHRYVHPSIKLIDGLIEEQNNNSDELYGVNVICDQIELIKPDIVFIYNDLIVISRIFNNFIERKIKRDFKVFSYLDLVYPYEKINLIDHVNKFSDLFFVLSDYWKENLIKIGIDEKKIKICPHGIDTNTFFHVNKLESRKKFSNLNDDDFIILNTNRNSYRKNIDKTIDAFIKFLIIKNCDKKIKLFLNMNTDDTILTNGYDILNLIKVNCVINDVNFDYISNNHIFTNPGDGYSDEMLNLLYNSCDIGINTCIGEGVGLCNLEHGSIGKPQIVSGVGGLRDIFNLEYSIVITPISEYYIPSNLDFHGGYAKICSTDDFVEGMIKYYDNESLYKSHGDICSTFLKEKYSWGKILTTFKNNIEEYLINHALENHTLEV